jgi:hypothetical protein
VLVTVAAVLALVVLAVLTVLQTALTAGAPLGRFTWGGRHAVLPASLRVGSVVAILLYAVFAALLVSKADLAQVVGEPVVTVAMWVVTVYLALSVLPNLASRSRPERALMTPVSAVLAACFAVVTIAG